MAPRVAFVSSHATLGGSELYLERLVEALDAPPAVITLAEGTWAQRMRERGAAVTVVPTGRRAGLLSGAWGLRRVLAAQRPDVIHANGVKAALVCVLAVPGLGIPVLWVKHDFSWDGRLAHAIAWRCARVVAVSSAVAATFGPRLRPRVEIVPNGIPPVSVDPVAARAAVAEICGSLEDAPVLIMVGRLDPVKAPLETIECLPGLLERWPELRLLLVGEPDRYRPEYAERVRARIAELGLQDSVVLAGRREDAVTLMAGADAVVVPTMRDERGMGTEGFGLVGVEAMAVGTPVAGYADGALPEVLGECAALVAPGDRTALAGAIARLLSDPAEVERLGACGRARVAERYTLRAMVATMRSQYEALATGRARGRAGAWGLALRVLRRRRSVILGFHGIGSAGGDPAADPENHLVSPERFRAEVGALVGAGFEVVTVAEFARRAAAAGGTPPPGLVSLSVDDGMDNNHSELLPLLRELGVPATIYVISGLVGRPNPWMGEGSGARMMTPPELADLVAAGVEIGAHTVTHPDLALLDEAACLDEMTRSKRDLEALLGIGIETFAYPYGTYAPPAVRAARRAGFTAAVTLEQGSWAPYELKRSMVTGIDGRLAFALKLLGLYQPLFHSSAGRALRAATRGIRRR